MQLKITAALAATAAVAAASQPGPFLAEPKDQARVGNLATDLLAGLPKTNGKQPNIIFILTDDQDLHLDSLNYLPLIKKHLADKGTFYRRHFCTTALCCPARVSLWTGKQAHNTNVTDVSPPYGGYPKFVSQGLNDNYLPVWLQAAGYNTYYTGKLFNAHTIENYNKPKANGWTTSDFLLDPYTYDYLNSSFQRNDDPPVSYEGQHLMDVLTRKAYGLLDDAAAGADKRPFFIGLAPVAPHSNVVIKTDASQLDSMRLSTRGGSADNVNFSAPIPAERHKDLFKGVRVPRTPNFNPENPSGVAWVSRLARQSQKVVDYNDHFYRQRLRALQGVDELVDGVFARLEKYGLLDNTYVFYTADNGYHIGQHRLGPGKECGFEEDINVPLFVRGPGVPAGIVTDSVTTHIDLAPTLLQLAQFPSRADFDGEPIPLTSSALDKAVRHDGHGRHEHVAVEYWGMAAFEGEVFDKENRFLNNTYKAVRIIGDSYNLYYSVWCSGEHELYNLESDPYQLNNLLGDNKDSASPATLLGLSLSKVVARLDTLVFILKSCKGRACVRPWDILHPDGDVHNLVDALSHRFDQFYEVEQVRVQYNRCEYGQIIDAEGPQFETEGLVYRHGLPWHHWT